ncbi:STM4014 family protein [Fulvivirga sediminis]|uniref:STM4014 family protein n=1 Tax=Fulvivirga sediminis TaxID=2803949 RepID=A0A937F4P2_9BACT|nr:STM4014 family protein [Fulvivirga sediminis]MBL3656342.1 STM4014 family protein [Fulvivirga sediminis]
MQLVLIGNPENRRSQYLKEAVNQKLLPPLLIISYQSLLENPNILHSLPSHGWLKIDSPGENFKVYQKILALAPDESKYNYVPADEALLLPYDEGRIYYSQQWYAGFKILLHKIELVLKDKPGLKLVNSIDSISLFFDKIASKHILTKNSIATPAFLNEIQHYDHLHQILEQKNSHQVFIKLAHGSSGSGVLAYRKNKKGQEMLTTSVELVNKGGSAKLYNSLKIRRYTDYNEIRTIINILAKERIYAEQWIPKASQSGGFFDLRCVTIGGEPTHMVMRQSRSPITNLHLGNARGDLSSLKKNMSDEQWKKIMALARKTAHTFNNTRLIGLDILLPPKLDKPMIIEANAFGDLLPRILHGNENTYEATVSYLLQEKK